MIRILETPRLNLRLLEEGDAEFYLELVTQPSWLRFIGNRGIETVEHARLAIAQGPLAMHARYGFCLYLVERRDDGEPLGICGLIKRDTLPDVDIGFAFLEAHCGRGYAWESASAVLEYGYAELGLRRLVAIVSPENAVSIKLIRKLGMRYEKQIRLTPEAKTVDLYARVFDARD
ncbi:MAG TPA: GNAT family N-acetyltransferase [Burkholderiaceae bacterium]